MARLLIDSFGGGTNLRDYPLDVKPPDLAGALDVLAHGEGGSVRNRPGDELVALLPGLSSGTFKRLWWAPVMQRLIAQTAENSLVALTRDGGIVGSIYTPASPSAADVYTLVEAPVSNVSQGPLYFQHSSTGVGATVKSWGANGTTVQAGAWSGTVDTDLTGVIPTEYSTMLVAANRLWLFGRHPSWVPDIADDSRVSWSDLGNPSAYRAENTLQLDPGKRDPIIGGAAYGNTIIIFKHARAWVIYDLDTGANRTLAEDVGALNADTIIPTPVGLLFIDPSRGPMVTDGSSTKLLPNGDKLGRDIWQTFTDATYLDEHVHFRSSIDGTIYDYDMRHASWWPYSYRARSIVADDNSLFAAREGDAAIDNVAGGTSDPPIRVDGTPLQPSVTLPPLDLGAPDIRKRITSLELTTRHAATLTTTFDVERAGPTLNVPDRQDGASSRLPGIGVGYTLGLKIQASPLAHGRFELSNVAVNFEPRAK